MAVLGYIAEHVPENLILWSSKKLCSKLDNDYHRNTENANASILAELLVRGFFNLSSQEISSCISKYLPSESFEQYNSWRANASPIQKPSQLFLVPQNGDPLQITFLQNVQIKAQHRFETLLGRCDGIVPVVLTESDGQKRGCAIPFCLERTDDSKSCVIDVKGTPIPEWSKAVTDLNLPGVCVRLLFDSTVDKDKNKDMYSGASLQLPVLMSYWRQNEQLPGYNPFAVVATGKIQDNRLVPVCLEQKYEGLSDYFGKLVFFYPDDNKTDNDYLFPIPVGTPVDKIKTICLEQIVSRNNDVCCGLTNFGIKYTVNQLKTISQSIKKDSEKTWDFTIKLLHLFLQELDRDEYPEHYLNALLTLSFAYCHNANTAQAHEYNRKAVDFARDVQNHCDLQYQLLLLSIEEMVLLQDEENFEQIPSLASEIASQLDQLDPECAQTCDLKMRYHGTLGQAHMCGAICKMEGFKKEEALDNIKKAIFFAGRYQEKTPEDNIDEVIRDKNYRHLWYALFKPDTEEELSLHEILVRETNEKQTPGKQKDNNLNFQFRQRCLAAYRRILQSNSNSDDSLADAPIPAPNSVVFWLKALIYKYQAAILAFQKRNEDAKERFEKSYDILKDCKDPLLQLIAMTIAAEAYRSFSELGDKAADEYHRKAQELFSANNDFQMFQTALPWKEFLDMSWNDFKASGKDFPGLNFYY